MKRKLSSIKKKTPQKINTRKRNSSFALFSLMVISLLVVILVAYLYKTAQQAAPIHIAFIGELTGSMSAVGQSSRDAVQLAVSALNQQGGIEVNGIKRSIILDIYDNESNIQKTEDVTRIAAQSQAVAIIGPNASAYAIAASNVAENNKILLLSPWSTDPTTTKNVDGTYKKYVFRTAFVDTVQASALAHFSLAALRASKAAILYDQTSDVLKKQANFFKDTFVLGDGAVTSVETFSPSEETISNQLRHINESSPHVIFLPAYYQDAAKIIKLAKQMGIFVPFLGSDAWGTRQMLVLCGRDCEGYYLSAHFAPDSTNPKVLAFDKEFKGAFRRTPDDVAALTYDSVSLIVHAIEKAQSTNKEAIVTAFSETKNFKGVTGNIDYKIGSGDPQKSVYIVKIVNGKFTFINEVYP